MATKEDKAGKSFLETLQSSVLTSIPVLSAVVFIIVTIKVFRVSGMETTTTVAIVSQADAFELLKGVILTLLPAFLEAITAASLWAWARVLPRHDPAVGHPQLRLRGSDEEEARSAREAARGALLSREAGVAWAFTAITFFTITWVVFLGFLLAVVATTVVLARAWRSGTPPGRKPEGLRVFLMAASFVVAAGSIGSLMLASAPWLPLRAVSVAPNHTLVLKNAELPRKVGAYVLKRDDKGTSLLIDHPRAVLEVGPGVLESDMPLCVPSPGSGRWYKIRASQVLGPDSNVPSPYPECP
jgi:hypothetical protein